MKINARKNVRKRYLKLKKIIEPLERFDDYFSEYDEEAAKFALVNFFGELKNIKPDEQFDLGVRQSYYSFYINLIPVYKALENGKYARACHEILTLNHYEPMLQKRIYSALFLLYKKFLE